MRRSLWLLICVCVLGLLGACGGGGTISNSGSGGPPQSPTQATHFAVGAPQNAITGTAFNFTVTALDASNNQVFSYSGTLQFLSTDSQAVLPGNSTLAHGTASFSATLKTAGFQTITATDSANTVSGTSTSIDVGNTAVTGGFMATGSMEFSREGHTATLLSNGRVLIAGGKNATGVLATAEIFDPATGTFTRADRMGTARVGHTATLLGDGKVLVAGGGTAKAEFFNPSTGVFTSTNNMIAARMGHTATLLNDGKVLLAGGTDSSGSALGDLFDPATATFSPTATGGTQALWLAAALLQDGRVFLAGGELNTLISGGGSSRCCLYGPDSYAFGILFESSDESFSAAGDMSTSRAFHTATLLNNGKVLIAGGATVHSVSRGPQVFTSVTPLASAELFDPISTIFAATGRMTTARSGHTATLLNSGTVLVTGGVDASGTVRATAEVYQ